MRNVVRIGGGELRGRRLRVPAAIRPTAAKVREALFSIWGERLRGGRFLDLFAGSGAVGLEALSRGARGATFVEKAPTSLAALRENCRELAGGRAEVRSGRLPDALARHTGTAYDFIFADPPYRFTAFAPLLERASPWLADGGELALEHSTRSKVPKAKGWKERDQKMYGESCLSFFVADERES